MEHLYDWFFTYNPHTKLWAAMRNEDIPLYKNDISTDKAIRSSSITSLQYFIMVGDGNLEKIQALFNADQTDKQNL